LHECDEGYLAQVFQFFASTDETLCGRVGETDVCRDELVAHASIVRALIFGEAGNVVARPWR
jgi:hypothetical protein